MAEQQVIARTPNALKHGVFARTLFIFKNDPEEFEALYQSLLEEWEPEGPSEEECIFSLATLYFRKRRLPLLIFCNHRKSQPQQGADPILNHLLESEPRKFYEDPLEAWRDAMRRMREPHHRPELDPLVERVANLLAASGNFYGHRDLDLQLGLELSLGKDYDYLCVHVRREDFSSTRDYLFALKKTIDEVLLPAARKELRDQVGTTEHDLLRSLSVMPPEQIEAELDLQEKIDHRIERQLAKLGRIRAMKCMGLGRSSRSGRKNSRSCSEVIDHEPRARPALGDNA